MQTFVYPNDYLKKGNIKHCWEVHKDRMKERGLPYVKYTTFIARVKRNKWLLKRAIYTPLDYKKMSWSEKLLVKIRTAWFRFIYLFKRWIEKK